MSGIAGIQTFTDAPPSQSRLTALGRALVHRGPDGEGRHTSGGTSLLHAAQASDPTAAEQPFVEPNGRIAVADGIAHDALAALTHLSRHVLAEGGRRAGAELAVPSSGHAGYAVAIHDPADDRLLLARDPYGLRPLYYAETPHGLVFASEPRAIVAAGLLSPKICTDNAIELMQLQFTTGTGTLIEGISRVLPGETVIAQQGRVVARMRAAPPPEVVVTPHDDGEPLARLETGLADALGLCLSDGPTGFYFSGGIDSLALLAALRRLERRDVPVFGILYGDSGTQEATERLTRLLAGSGLKEEWVTVGARDFWGGLPKIVALLDDPGSDYGAVALSLLAQRAGRDVHAMITAAGGAEMFGLYSRYRSILRPLWLGGRSMRPRGFLEGLNVLRESGSAWRDGLRAAESRLAQRGYTRLQAAQALDCLFWLPNDHLSVLDRCFAPQGVEARMPYLTDALAQFAFTLPDRLKISGGAGGFLLRRWLARVLPESEPFHRHKPHAVPALRWLAQEAGRLAPLVARNPGVAALCEPHAVARLFARLSAGGSKRQGHAAWQLLFFALWHAIHIEGKAPDGDAFAVLNS